MASPSDSLLEEGGGKPPRLYEVERGVKTDSYITAVSNNPIPPFVPSAQYAKKPRKASVEDPDAIEGAPAVRLKAARPEGAFGLTEKELEQYRDDPFWSGLRKLLLALFFFLILLLFLLILLLLLFSPPCAHKIAPSWWQSAIAYNVWVPSFADSDGDGRGDVDGLIERLEQLRKSGVQTVWPSPFLLSDEFSDAVRDHRAIDSKLGVNTDADKLIAAVHDKGMKLIIDFPLTTTSMEHDWFLRSQAASKEENKEYAEYYTWSAKAGLDPSYFSKLKSVSYFHKDSTPSSPVLNWSNARVKMAIFDVLSSWIDRGVDGFHLTGLDYLARSPNFTRPDSPAITEFVRDIRTHVETYSNESVGEGAEPKKIIVFASLEESKEKDKRELVSATHLNSLINYELSKVEKNTKICHKNEGNVGLCTYEILADLMLFHNLHEDVVPSWEFGNPSVPRLASRVGSRKHAELLLMVQLMLPGSNAFYYGDELGMRNLQNDTKADLQRGAMQWDDSPGAGFSSAAQSSFHAPLANDYKNINWKRQYSEEQSMLKTFQKLSKLRQRDEVLISGKTLMGRLIDGSAFTMARFLQGDGGNATAGQIYVLAVNFSPHPVSLPLVVLPSSANLDRSSVVAVSSNVIDFDPRDPLDLGERKIEVGADQGILFKYPAV